ncbi:hypothetical protein OS493_004772 [Desmophyllum pertusum]|uniref:Uncharacterized protein n=1 Tax=Desmophyllum pertusum TaxID=174260 RepID=A0A9W9ZID9_9CNID|nr:hypothetical protein OS493_004772 [Desmophyllum pertusum]
MPCGMPSGMPCGDAIRDAMWDAIRDAMWDAIRDAMCLSALLVEPTLIFSGNLLEQIEGDSRQDYKALEFKLENGNLKHTLSGKCVQPIGAVTDGVALGLYSSCGGHQFSFTAGGSLQHVGSKKCCQYKIRAPSRSAHVLEKPVEEASFPSTFLAAHRRLCFQANNEEIVLNSKCENKRDVSLNKDHLRFNFIPSRSPLNPPGHNAHISTISRLDPEDSMVYDVTNLLGIFAASLRRMKRQCTNNYSHVLFLIADHVIFS